MQVFVFRSRRDTSVLGFTTRRGGGNLPAEFAIWEPVERLSLLPGIPVAGAAVGSETILADIQRDGFCVTRSI
ncbi:MAG: hypothetical protein ABSE20_20575 [Acetobacteraceae bacterium]|jgi:hypothetical protein